MPGLYYGLSGGLNFSNFKPAFPDVITLTTLGVFGAAMTGSLFSADAWNNITFTAGEVRNPQKNLPMSLLLGTGTVILLYLLANVSYLSVLSIGQIQTAENDRVATLMMETILGSNGKYFIAAMIMVSTFRLFEWLHFYSSACILCNGKRWHVFKTGGEVE